MPDLPINVLKHLHTLLYRRKAVLLPIRRGRLRNARSHRTSRLCRQNPPNLARLRRLLRGAARGLPAEARGRRGRATREQQARARRADDARQDGSAAAQLYRRVGERTALIGPRRKLP